MNVNSMLIRGVYSFNWNLSFEFKIELGSWWSKCSQIGGLVLLQSCVVYNAFANKKGYAREKGKMRRKRESQDKMRVLVLKSLEAGEKERRSRLWLSVQKNRYDVFMRIARVCQADGRAIAALRKPLLFLHRHAWRKTWNSCVCHRGAVFEISLSSSLFFSFNLYLYIKVYIYMYQFFSFFLLFSFVLVRYKRRDLDLFPITFLRQLEGDPLPRDDNHDDTHSFFLSLSPSTSLLSTTYCYILHPFSYFDSCFSFFLTLPRVVSSYTCRSHNKIWFDVDLSQSIPIFQGGRDIFFPTLKRVAFAGFSSVCEFACSPLCMCRYFSVGRIISGPVFCPSQLWLLENPLRI